MHIIFFCGLANRDGIQKSGNQKPLSILRSCYRNNEKLNSGVAVIHTKKREHYQNNSFKWFNSLVVIFPTVILTEWK